MRIAMPVGTRPEAVKIAPVVTALRARGAEAVVVDTGQQPGRVAEALEPFGLRADESLGIVRRTGELTELSGVVSRAVDELITGQAFDALLVQGDTTSAFAAALAAHHRSLPVIHLEAGLRTGDPRNPFPEESNRKLIAAIADLHLAPTPLAAAALAREGHAGPQVVVTGNTVVDALSALLPAARSRASRRWASMRDYPGQPVLVVTVHRREAWGAGVDAVTGAVRDLVARNPELRVAVVTHPNPALASTVRATLTDVPRCRLLPPLPYDVMLSLLCSADVALTDSGGIQEEAPSLHLPIVVARRHTERPEGIAAGVAQLVGLDRSAMVAGVESALATPLTTRLAMANPYGDGRAGERSAAAIAWLLGAGERPADWVPASIASTASDDRALAVAGAS
jgi:UDP-N-acetylglucosamine 2-epimerase (non-hydrolysing)